MVDNELANADTDSNSFVDKREPTGDKPDNRPAADTMATGAHSVARAVEIAYRERRAKSANQCPVGGMLLTILLAR